MRRKKLNKRQSKKNFRKGVKQNKRNRVRVMRGGYRI